MRTRKTVVDIRVEGHDLKIDRNFEPIFEDQRKPVVLRFGFPPEWDDKYFREVSILNGEKVCQLHMDGDEVVVPEHMLTEGRLKIIVRAFFLERNIWVVRRGCHLVVTNEVRDGDVPGYAHSDLEDRLYLSTFELKRYPAWVREYARDRFSLTNEILYNSMMGEQPDQGNGLGYSWAQIEDDEAIYVGRKRVR